ncbi:uncharacterized protein LOC142350476 [Convolutriloba macropyga]|uniref:uncharacterized protein LOC142350476 n=1 Tax=Convolutriloba macropyga TaxID=536237 RepID=UPI003F52769A
MASRKPRKPQAGGKRSRNTSATLNTSNASSFAASSVTSSVASPAPVSKKQKPTNPVIETIIQEEAAQPPVPDTYYELRVVSPPAPPPVGTWSPESYEYEDYAREIIVHDWVDDVSLRTLIRVLEEKLNAMPSDDPSSLTRSGKRRCQLSFRNGNGYCYEELMPRIKVQDLKVSKSIPTTLLDVDRILHEVPLFAIISASTHTETYLALATVGGQYAVPVIDAGVDNRKGYFALENIQLYFHVEEEITRSKEIEGLVRVLNALSLRTMGVIYEEKDPYDVFYEEFAESIIMNTQESARRGELENIFTVTNQYNLTIPNNEGFRAACKSLLLNDQTTLIIIGSARFHRKVYKECQEYIDKHRPALISSSDIMAASQKVVSLLPNGILTLKATNQTLNKKLLDAVRVAQLSVYYVYEYISTQPEEYSELFRSIEEIFAIEGNQPKALKVALLREVKKCFKKQNYNPICNENIPQTFQVQNLYTSETETTESGEALKTWHDKGKVTDRYVQINSIKWTGNQYFNLKSNQNKPELKITIATIEPFLIWREPNSDKSCDFGHVCYPYLRGADVKDIDKRVDDIILNFTVTEEDVKCCDGLEVELIDRLSKDLQFEYILYFGNFPAGLVKKGTDTAPQNTTTPVTASLTSSGLPTSSGRQQDPIQWQGMVGSVYHGQADLSIGSISITNERSQFVRFSSPYFYSGFAIMVAKKPPEPEKFAFLKPMSWRVWLLILLCCKGVAVTLTYVEMLSRKVIARAILKRQQQQQQKQSEQSSPWSFAIKALKNNQSLPANQIPPLASAKLTQTIEESEKEMPKKPAKISRPTASGGEYWYGMSSSLNSVFGILFLHTLPTKMPRGTATKCITHIWAGISVLVVSCYTANLASFMTGRLTYLDLDISVMINSQKEYSYGAVKGSSVQKYIGEQWAHMQPILAKHLVNSASDAFQQLKNGTLDAYFDDAPIVYWEVATDPDCKLVAVGNTFGDDYYGIVVSNDISWDPFYMTLNEYINRYRDNLYLDKLREKWLEDYRSCPSRDEIQNSLGLSHIGGLFYALIAACVVSFVILIVEILVEKGLDKFAVQHQPPKFLKHHSLQLYEMWKHKENRQQQHQSSDSQSQELHQHQNGSVISNFTLRVPTIKTEDPSFKPGVKTTIVSHPDTENPYIHTNQIPTNQRLTKRSTNQQPASKSKNKLAENGALGAKTKTREKEILDLYKEVYSYEDEDVQYEIHV